MKVKSFLLVLLIVATCVLAGCFPLYAGGNGTGEKVVNVIMINDNHGTLNEDSGGLDKIATGIKQYESQGNVVKIANGDIFQGTYVSSTLRGLPMLDALNAMNFDCFVIGNHEFDWGFDEIKKYKDGDTSNGEANFPFLGANIIDVNTGEMVDWLEPYTIVEVDGIKVGVIGIIGELEDDIMSVYVEDYDFVNPTKIVEELASELRTTKDCDAVIVAAHADDLALNDNLAHLNGDARLDGIFTAHSHTETNRRVTRVDNTSVCILQNGGYGKSFANLALTFDANGNVKSASGKINYTKSFVDTGILDSVVEEYQDIIASGDEVVLTLNRRLSREEVGLLVAESMCVTLADVHFGVINTGGVRTALEAGEVTRADIFKCYPFENVVWFTQMTGGAFKQMVEEAPFGFYYWGVLLDKVHDDAQYTVAIVDYLYLSDDFASYRSGEYLNTGELLRDIFTTHLKNLNK